MEIENCKGRVMSTVYGKKIKKKSAQGCLLGKSLASDNIILK